jgi:hypothetical protein
VFVERREGKGREGSVSHEDEEGAGSPLGLVRVLARLPLPTPGGGLLGALALHHQPAATILLFKIESIDRSAAIEREREEKSSLGVGLGDALGFGPLHGWFLREHQRRRSDPPEAARIGREGDESRANWEGGGSPGPDGARREKGRGKGEEAGKGGGDWG